MTKLVTVIGTRPQIIKYAPLQMHLQNSFSEILINTGQHYDRNMAGDFFNELGIRCPEYDLEVGSGSHGKQTAVMLSRIEEILMKEMAEGVIVFGDTNSTLAGTLAASKLNIPVFHIEAGLRSFNKKMPEEQNRIVSDHLSTLLFCPTVAAVENLKSEGISAGVFQVGDIMYDATLMYSQCTEKKASILKALHISEKNYHLMTFHRAENTQDIQKLRAVLSAVEKSGYPVVFPVHPRTRKFIDEQSVKIPKNVILTEPLGYHDILNLQKNAKKILTDSGGVQKEAFFLGTPCIVLREETEWVELIANGNNVLTGTDEKKLLEALVSFEGNLDRPDYYGDGTAALKIVDKLRAYFGV